MRVLVELRHSPDLHGAAVAAEPAPALTASLGDRVKGLELDPGFPPVQIPAVEAEPAPALAMTELADFSLVPERSTYLTRGSVPDDPDGQQAALAETASDPNVVGVFSDPAIESSVICPGDPAMGDDGDVATLLGTAALGKAGLDGTGVLLAVVDTGINLAYLRSKGHQNAIDVANSWTPTGVTTGPGSHPVNHGTMCGYDVGIAAPGATLVDHAVLLSKTPGSTVMAGLLSDAVLSYSRLLTLIAAMPADRKALVVSNSWGMFDPAWDFPVGHPGNYSDNPRHPFNVLVGSLARAGADVLFAAGNCGRDCPDGRCKFGTTAPICGANSHPSVISVAGVDVTKTRVGYSSQGPGRLSARKPSLSAYTHFKGSGVYPEDGGTSAACPVLAGYVAAVRTRHPASQLSPMQLRSVLYKTAQDLGGVGYDFDHGWGVPDTTALLAKLP